MLKSEWLWYLIQIKNYSSLSLAAEQLYITQPSLSNAIKKLEEQLGLQLLTRTYRGVALTEDGKKVVKLAEKAFDYMNEIEKLSSDSLKQKIEKHILDDCLLYVNPHIAQIIIAAIAKLGVGINCPSTLKILNINEAIDIEMLLQSNDKVFSFTILDETLTLPAGLAMHIFHKSKAQIICGREFPFFGPEQNAVSFRDLIKIPFVVSNSPLNFQKTLMEQLSRYGNPNIKAIALDESTVLSMVENNIGASFFVTIPCIPPNDTFRLLALHDAPQFITALVYNKNCPKEKVDTLVTLIETIM